MGGWGGSTAPHAFTESYRACYVMRLTLKVSGSDGAREWP